MTKVKFRPVKNKILIKQIFEEKDNKTESGLILSATQEDKSNIPTNRAEVIRVGKDTIEVEENQTIMFDNKGVRVKLGEEEYVVTTEDNVFGIFEP